MPSKEIDRHAVRELELYGDNDYSLYQQRKPYLENMKKKMAKGTYDPKKGVKLWEYYVERVARAYAKEVLREPTQWSKMFPKNVRHEAAKHYEAEARQELRGG